VPFEVGTFNNDSPAKLLGTQLKQEESQSASIGFTAKIENYFNSRCLHCKKLKTE
jgi:hypothetical protein